MPGVRTRKKAASAAEGTRVPPSLRFTSADLEGLPDIDNVRYEIIDGDLFVSKAPHHRHQYASGVLIFSLHDWNTRTGAGIEYVAPGLIFSPENDVIPDLVWFSRERVALAEDAAGHFRAAPDLVVEVLSPGRANESRDRDLKLRLYSRQGVGEYWLVDWRRRVVHVYRREQAELRLALTLRDGDDLTSPMLPGFTCPIVSLWEPSFDP